MRTFYTGATNIGCIQSGAAIATEFHDAHIVGASLKISFKSTGKNRISVTKHYSSGKKSSAGSGCCSKAPVGGLAPGKSGEYKCRVNDQHAALVIMFNIETDHPVFRDPVLNRDGFPA